MKTISVREMQKALRKTIETAQRNRVVVTRHGKPVAVIRGVEGLDWESILLEGDTEFWQMVETRRGERTLSMDEVAKKVGTGKK